MIVNPPMRGSHLSSSEWQSGNRETQRSSRQPLAEKKKRKIKVDFQLFLPHPLDGVIRSFCLISLESNSANAH